MTGLVPGVDDPGGNNLLRRKCRGWNQRPLPIEELKKPLPVTTPMVIEVK